MNKDFKAWIPMAISRIIKTDAKSLVCIAVSLVLCIASFINLSELKDIGDDIGKIKDQMAYVQSDVDNIDRNVVNGFNTLLDNINESDAEKESLISYKSHEYNGDLFCYVIPKEFNPETTKVTLMRGKEEFSMSFKNGVYELTVDAETVSKMEEGDGVYFDVLVITENGISKTQFIDWRL